MEARLDKWLWAARIYKTRSLAADACKNGRVSINGAAAKPARTVKEGDEVSVRKSPITYTFRVKQAIDSPVDSLPGIFLCRCRHLPGDTLRLNGELFTVPGIRPTCSREDYYGVESLSSRSPVSRFIGIVAERHIIGRAVCVLYSHDDTQSPFSGFRQDRFFATIVTEP